MSKQTPTSFESTTSALERLLPGDVLEHLAVRREPASNAAVVFGAIIQARATDRLTKAVERNTRALLLASGNFSTAHIVQARRALDDPKWEGRS